MPSCRTVLLHSVLAFCLTAPSIQSSERPDILVFIADDLSWPHTSFAGCNFVETPAFDRIAREGVYFSQAFASSPICTPSRSSLLTGRQPWQCGAGMQLLGTLPAELPTFPNVLADHGYRCGYTGKVWGPGTWQASGRQRDPSGTGYFTARLATTPSSGITQIDIPGNFRQFLADLKPNDSFCFIAGSHEPHVPYEAGSGLRAGLDPATVRVPPFLPDTPQTRSDLLDYALEIQHLDGQLAGCLAALEAAGRLDNTLVLFYGDNGMPFPAAKHTCYEYGIRVPVALYWPTALPGGQQRDELIATPDLTATIYAATGITPPPPGLAGANLLPELRAASGADLVPGREAIVVGHERGNFCRTEDRGFPMRALRTDRHLLIINYTPERVPVGDPPAFLDVDPLPIKDLLIARQDDPAIAPFHSLAFGPRPALQLFDIRQDPACFHNLADAQPELAARLRAELEEQLRADEDPRALGNGEEFEAIPWYTWKDPSNWIKPRP